MSAGIGGINVDGGAGGAAAGGISNINISAGTTSNNLSAVTLASSPTVRFGLNASTVTAAPVEMSIWRNFHGNFTNAGTVGSNSAVSIQPFLLQWPVGFSNLYCPIFISFGSTANTSSAYLDLSVSAVFYSRNVSTLSYITSISNTMTSSYSSNGGISSAIYAITASNIASTVLTPGEYYMALHVSTSNSATNASTATSAVGASFQMIIAYSQLGIGNIALKTWGAGAANQSLAVMPGVGLFSTGATRSSIAFSDYTASSSGNVAPAAFELRNATWWG